MNRIKWNFETSNVLETSSSTLKPGHLSQWIKDIKMSQTINNHNMFFVCTFVDELFQHDVLRLKGIFTKGSDWRTLKHSIFFERSQSRVSSKDSNLILEIEIRNVSLWRLFKGF